MRLPGDADRSRRRRSRPRGRVGRGIDAVRSDIAGMPAPGSPARADGRAGPPARTAGGTPRGEAGSSQGPTAAAATRGSAVGTAKRPARGDAGASTPPRQGLAELALVGWRPVVDVAWLRRYGIYWSMWTWAIAITFAIPGVVLLALSPWTLPVALASFAHGWVICELYARRGVNPMRPSPASDSGSQRVALGLLGDLLGHDDRGLAMQTGCAIQRGALGVWVVGEAGALMVRPGGRRTDCWCVRVGDARGLPPADRVSHLLLALREDEHGFATVANLAFSGATWRVRRRLPGQIRPALDAAQRVAAEPPRQARRDLAEAATP